MLFALVSAVRKPSLRQEFCKGDLILVIKALEGHRGQMGDDEAVRDYQWEKMLLLPGLMAKGRNW